MISTLCIDILEEDSSLSSHFYYIIKQIVFALAVNL